MLSSNGAAAQLRLVAAKRQNIFRKSLFMVMMSICISRV